MKIYISLISDAMSAKYPDEYQRVFWSDRYWTIFKTTENFTYGKKALEMINLRIWQA